MSDMLAIGQTGVRAYARALDLVADNVANAVTPGHVRRTADLSPVNAGGGGGLLNQLGPPVAHLLGGESIEPVMAQEALQLGQPALGIEHRFGCGIPEVLPAGEGVAELHRGPGRLGKHQRLHGPAGLDFGLLLAQRCGSAGHP